MARSGADRPVGVHVDALHEIRKAMRALRRAERRIIASIRAEKRLRGLALVHEVFARSGGKP